MPAPHKIVLSGLLEEQRALVERFEAAVERLETMAAPHIPIPTDPVALELAERHIKMRSAELMGLSGDDVPVPD